MARLVAKRHEFPTPHCPNIHQPMNSKKPKPQSQKRDQQRGKKTYDACVYFAWGHKNLKIS